MADLTTNFAGIESPNPFWLASGPPTNTYGQVAKAFDAGWGGAVWKTLGEDPPIVNVSGPRSPSSGPRSPRAGGPRPPRCPGPRPRCAAGRAASPA